MQLYRYFVSQYSEFCRHNPLCCFSTRVYCCERIFRYRLSLEILDTPSYITDALIVRFLKFVDRFGPLHSITKTADYFEIVLLVKPTSERLTALVGKGRLRLSISGTSQVARKVKEM
jgi:hypothetical protein